MKNYNKKLKTKNRFQLLLLHQLLTTYGSVIPKRFFGILEWLQTPRQSHFARFGSNQLDDDWKCSSDSSNPV
ncbi:MAG: hypothetical protein DRQ49_12625 [Gammaproteobacteria bacterium]|nr:MAG: hypothetical protein DRQ49_12625 [Gammaproteobacteria bacterium]RKZ40334.1 MAG: hypothetical protein DRQ41_09520 [Gammaproteobacteria bacterium]